MATNEAGHTMAVAARRTGLTPHVIRVWEKRYKAVQPARTATNRRLYSNEDIERLKLLSRLTKAGHSIGRIAQLTREKLLQMWHEEQIQNPTVLEMPIAIDRDGYLQESMKAIRELDIDKLETILTRASVALSQPEWLEKLLAPLLHEIGDQWKKGSLRIAHEHFASAMIRTLLGSARRSFEAASPSAPVIVFTTPAGQLHELGALMAAVTAASDGWRVLYLGPNLPAEEIAASVSQHRARAVALSMVYPSDDARVHSELMRLRQLIGKDVAIILGGRAVSGYNRLLSKIKAVAIPDFQSFRAVLESIRTESG